MRYLSLAIAAAAASFVSLSAAVADPIYGLPIDLLGATFSDGTALTGEITLNAYGYVEQGSIIDTVAGSALNGTPIAGVSFTESATVAAFTILAPNVISAGAVVGGEGYALTLTFDHSLGTPGADPFVLDLGYTATPNSAECFPWSCSDSSKERLITAGVAFVPEPVSAALLGTGLLGLLVARRRRA